MAWFFGVDFGGVNLCEGGWGVVFCGWSRKMDSSHS